MSYIEREPLLEILNGLYKHHLAMFNYAADSATADCVEAVINAPEADVVPRSKADKARLEGYESGKRANLYSFSVEKLAEKCEQLAGENERLRIENQALKTECMLNKKRDDFSLGLLLKARADTVKKVLHLVKERAESCEIIIASSIRPIDTIYQISNTELEKIAKEMLEDTE